MSKIPPPLIRPARKLPPKQKKKTKKKRQRRFSDILKEIQEEGRIAGINNRALQKKITLVF